MQQLAGCSDGATCPGVWIDEENDMILVRGDLVPATALARADGEQVIQIPLGILTQAAQQL